MVRTMHVIGTGLAPGDGLLDSVLRRSPRVSLRWACRTGVGLPLWWYRGSATSGASTCLRPALHVNAVRSAGGLVPVTAFGNHVRD
jgi:hypothetical protein